MSFHYLTDRMVLNHLKLCNRIIPKKNDVGVSLQKLKAYERRILLLSSALYCFENKIFNSTIRKLSMIQSSTEVE